MYWAVMTQTAIGAVLVAAAIAKVVGQVSIRAFLDALAVPSPIGSLIAVALPVAEGSCGLLLILRIGGDPVLFAAAALAAAFAVTLLVAQARGVTTGCRCFGVLDSPRLTPLALARAVVLALAALALVLWGRGASDPARAEAIWLGLLAAIGYVSCFAMLGQVYEFERGRAAVLKRVKTAEESSP
jgi:hypothetical protein